MAASVFFAAPVPLTIADIAGITGARPVGDDVGKLISGVASLTAAGPEDISFFDNARYGSALAATGAGACFCLARDVPSVPRDTIALETSKPHEAFAKVAAALYPAATRLQPAFGGGIAGISNAAHIHPEARIEDAVTVEPGVSIGAGAEIGSGSLVSAGAVIGPGVRVGRDCSIGPNAVVTHALFGDRVVVHAGSCIGQDGFGYIPGAGGHRKVVQIGRVIIQDDVEIGANTTIDRGSVRDTVIGEGTKIDNLVQIGHNVTIGRHCLIAGHVGISGSVTIGDASMLGGKVGVRDNVSIGRGVVIAAASSVGGDIPDGERWGGTPARPVKEWLREITMLRRLTLRRGKKIEGTEDTLDE